MGYVLICLALPMAWGPLTEYLFHLHLRRRLAQIEGHSEALRGTQTLRESVAPCLRRYRCCLCASFALHSLRACACAQPLTHLDQCCTLSLSIHSPHFHIYSARLLDLRIGRLNCLNWSIAPSIYTIYLQAHCSPASGKRVD